MTIKFFQNVCRRLQKYAGHEGGALAIVFALTLPLLIASGGMALDLAAAYNAKARLNNALDKAALAAASSIGTEDEIRERMLAFFNANYPSDRFGIPYDVVLSISNGRMTVSAHAHVPTMFMNLFGHDYLDISSSSEVVLNMSGVEAVLVLDVTGSMAGSNIEALKTASASFINLVFDRISDTNFLKIGIVPWSVAVNVGPYGKGKKPDGTTYGSPFVDNPDTDPFVTPASDIVYGAGRYDWRGCVLERSGAAALLDTASPHWKMYRYPGSSCTSWQCLEYGCARYTCTQRECSQYNCVRYSDGSDGGSGSGGGASNGALGGGTGDGGDGGAVGDLGETRDGGSRGDKDITGGGIIDDEEVKGEDEEGGGGSGTCVEYGDTCLAYTGTCTEYGDTCEESSETCLRGECTETTGNPNLNCPNSPIVPLTNSKTQLLSAINSLSVAGNTYSNLGMVWGWRVISPEFPFTEGAAYDNPNWAKTVILMTDGDNTVNTFYSGEGEPGTPGLSMTPEEQNAKFTQICTNMKEKGIQIYTVTFQSDINETTKDVYRNCATNENMYFDAPTDDELVDAFQKIANQLTRLHLAR